MSAEARGGGTPPPIFEAVIEHIAGAAPELRPRYAYIEKHWVVVEVNQEFEARLTTNGVMWCGNVVRREGGDVWKEGYGLNLGTHVSHLSEDAAEIGDAIIKAVVERRTAMFREQNDVDFKTLVAAAVNDGDPTLEAGLYAGSPGIYCVRVRLTANMAAIIGDVDISWGGDVEKLVDGDWMYADEEGGTLDLSAAPEVDYYEQIPAGTAERVAAEILKAARSLRETLPEPEGVVKEYLLLVEDVRNPAAGSAQFHAWRDGEKFSRGSRFVISRESGRKPRLYPTGGFEMQYVEAGEPVYDALRPHLQQSSPTLRELLVEEKADAIAILEALVHAGVTTNDNIIQTMHELKERGVVDISREV